MNQDDLMPFDFEYMVHEDYTRIYAFKYNKFILITTKVLQICNDKGEVLHYSANGMKFQSSDLWIDV